MFNWFKRKESEEQALGRQPSVEIVEPQIEENRSFDYVVSQELFPKASINGVGGILVWVESLVKNGSFVKKGQPIMKYRDSRICFSGENCGEITALFDGYYFFHDTLGISHIPNIGSVICSTYLSIDELINNHYQTSYYIGRDVFDGNKSIKWEHIFGALNGVVFGEKNDVRIIYSCQNNQAVLRLHFGKTLEKGAVKISVAGGDRIHMLLSNQELLDFIVPAPTKINDYVKECIIPLSPLDIEKLKGSPLYGIRIAKKNSDVSVDYYVNIDKKIWLVLYTDYVSKYLDALEECEIDWKTQPSTVEQNKAEINNEECYVYLMHDTTNNAYKIGISNKPHYREHTLQSEKPFIELLGSKQFPTRKIAAAFESALHDAYYDKHIRGEWFFLDDDDVKNVLESLK